MRAQDSHSPSVRHRSRGDSAICSPRELSKHSAEARVLKHTRLKEDGSGLITHSRGIDEQYVVYFSEGTVGYW